MITKLSLSLKNITHTRPVRSTMVLWFYTMLFLSIVIGCGPRVVNLKSLGESPAEGLKPTGNWRYTYQSKGKKSGYFIGRIMDTENEWPMGLGFTWELVPSTPKYRASGSISYGEGGAIKKEIISDKEDIHVRFELPLEEQVYQNQKRSDKIIAIEVDITNPFDFVVDPNKVTVTLIGKSGNSYKLQW